MTRSFIDDCHFLIEPPKDEIYVWSRMHLGLIDCREGGLGIEVTVSEHTED